MNIFYRMKNIFNFFESLKQNNHIKLLRMKRMTDSFDIDCAKRLKQTDTVNQKIFEYLLQHANDGNIHAQYQLAKCYEKGLGTVKDSKLALYWFELSSRNGSDS